MSTEVMLYRIGYSAWLPLDGVRGRGSVYGRASGSWLGHDLRMEGLVHNAGPCSDVTLAMGSYLTRQLGIHTIPHRRKSVM